MNHRRWHACLFLVLLGLLMMLPARPAMADAKRLAEEYVIDLRAGTLKLSENAESQAVYNTINAMNNNGVTGYEDGWDMNEFNLDPALGKTKDLVIREDEGYTYTVAADYSIKEKITLGINAETLDALKTDGYDYYEKITFLFPKSLPVQITGASVLGPSETEEYTGSAQKPPVRLSLSGLILQEGTHYSIAYKDNTNVGTATITITGIGTCTGTITKTFTITGKAAAAVSDTIAALKSADGVTLADKASVAAAREAYNSLTEAQKTLVPSDKLKKLTDAESKIAALEKEAANAAVKGKVYTVLKLKYKVINADRKGKGTAALVGTMVKKSRLKKLTVPAAIRIRGAKYKITAIGSNAFKGFAKLKTVTIKTTVLKSVGKNAFRGIHKKAVFKVPKKQLKKYKRLFSSKAGFKKTMTVRK